MWTELQSLLDSGLFNAAAVAIQERLYVIGGHNGQSPTNQMHIFDSNLCTWSTAPAMQKERFQFDAAVLGRYIYAVGGDSTAGAVRSMERYDTQRRTPMSCRRKGCVAVGVGEYIYVFGGHDGTQVLNSCERYDPVSESWSPLPAMTHKRFGSAIAVLGNRIFVIGGFDGKAAMDTVEVFTVPSSQKMAVQSNYPGEEEKGETPSLKTKQSLTDGPPDELQCPITGDLMVDPVVASDGHSYEREAIEEWFRRFPGAGIPRSPSTNGPIERKLFPNHNLKLLCRQYADTHPIT